MKANEHGVLPASASSPVAAHSRNSAALIVRGGEGRRELDLGRDVHALMGLVFDRIDLAGFDQWSETYLAPRKDGRARRAVRTPGRSRPARRR